ncbi:uroporphyrinogen decarboxylase [Capnocytophaga sp. H4358]|uniref:uroporphyrinogen decarboxylase n=1 Tax=Capnocytophaga TaxID=1016 RepID=UPI000BB1B4CA|nr:uroporphyrinogen decarboxylase [Capnocytophaga sp. H4358]ATA72599.1 uroporphyrinogen decarboxylase [Capnocytophaga sp. H4358]
MSWYDFIGYAASLFVVGSFLIKDNIIYIRLTNLIGCVLFVIYGVLINNIPIILPNAFLMLVQIYFIFLKRKDKKKQTCDK